MKGSWFIASLLMLSTVTLADTRHHAVGQSNPQQSGRGDQKDREWPPTVSLTPQQCWARFIYRAEGPHVLETEHAQQAWKAWRAQPQLRTASGTRFCEGLGKAQQCCVVVTDAVLRSLKPGDTFSTGDGCNTCTVYGRYGESIHCTLVNCVPEYLRSP